MCMICANLILDFIIDFYHGSKYSLLCTPFDNKWPQWNLALHQEMSGFQRLWLTMRFILIIFNTEHVPYCLEHFEKLDNDMFSVSSFPIWLWWFQVVVPLVVNILAYREVPELRCSWNTDREATINCAVSNLLTFSDLCKIKNNCHHSKVFFSII